MPQLDILIILPLLLGLLLTIYFHYKFLIEFNIPYFFGVKKLRSKLIALKKHNISSLKTH